MDIHYFLTAKYAEMSIDGSTTIIGAGVPVVQCTSLPFLFPSFYLVAKVALDRTEARSGHSIAVVLIGPDGDEIFHSDDSQSQGHELPPDREYFFMNLVMAFNNLLFSQAGLFKFQLIFDGELAKVFPFRLELSQRTIAEDEQVEEGAA